MLTHTLLACSFRSLLVLLAGLGLAACSGNSKSPGPDAAPEEADAPPEPDAPVVDAAVVADMATIPPDAAEVDSATTQPDAGEPDGPEGVADAAEVDVTPDVTVPGCAADVPFMEQLAASDATVLTGTPVYFNAGQPVPAGRYTVRYVDGCMKYAAMFEWSVHGNDPPDCCNWWLIGDAITDRRAELPGTTGYMVNMGGYIQFEDCVTANKALPPITYDHPGGKLGISVDDVMYPDNVVGMGGRNPTWSLTQGCGP